MRAFEAVNATLGVAIAVLAAASNAHACGACRGAGGAGGALTAADERWNVSLLSLGRYQVGSSDWSGRAHLEPRDVTAVDATWTVAAAVRFIRPLEVGIFGGGGVAWMRAPGLDTIGGSATDLTLRARYDVLAEDPSHLARPAIAVWNALRVPTGATGGQTFGSTAGQIGAFGLGTWELAWGADFRRTLARAWQPFVAVEAAWRAPDAATGSARVLGPRVGARTGVTWFVDDVYALSFLVEWGIEANVSLDHRDVPGSWQERTSTGVAGSAHLANGMRLALGLASDLPIDGLGRNAEATLRATFSIGYSGIESAWRRCPVPGLPVIARAPRGANDG
jgi:hypothetical protein